MTDQPKLWNEIIRSLPGAHFLQVREWADVKRSVGWTREEITWKNEEGDVKGAAQLLTRSMHLLRFGPRVSLGYIPRGPMFDWNDEAQRLSVLNTLETTARQRGLIFIKIDPDVTVDTGNKAPSNSSVDIPGSQLVNELKERGWKYSPEQMMGAGIIIPAIPSSFPGTNDS